MINSIRLLRASSLPIVAGMMFAVSVHAQEVAPVDTPPVAAPEQVDAPPPISATPTVTPPPAVPTIAPSNDRIAPQAKAEAEAERAERIAERRATRAVAPATRPETRIAAPTPPTEAIAPDPAPTVNVPADPVDSQLTDTDTVGPVAVAADMSAATDANDGTNEWLLGVGIVGALGLAGIALAMRRRRRPGDVVAPAPAHSAPASPAMPTVAERKPVLASTFAAPDMDRFFAQQREQAAQRSNDPLFAARADDARLSSDPLFAYKPEQTPVTDPLFSRKIDVPPVTDPMFAHHPEYEGRGADRRVDRIQDGESVNVQREPQLVN